MFQQALKYAAAIGTSAVATHQYLTFNPNQTEKKLETQVPATAIEISQELKRLTEFQKVNKYAQEIQKWDKNWDHRNSDNQEHPESDFVDVKLPGKNGYRNIFLIRHGQYHTKAATADEKKLTDLGHEQAKYCGNRLAQMFNLVEWVWEILLPNSCVLKSLGSVFSKLCFCYKKKERDANTSKNTKTKKTLQNSSTPPSTSGL